MSSLSYRLGFIAAFGAVLACSSGELRSGDQGDDNLIPIPTGGTSSCTMPPCENGAGGSALGTGGTGGGALATGGSNGPGPELYDCTRSVNTATYSFDANVVPSQLPPAGLPVEDTPLFVALSFDDNPQSDGMSWATEFFQTQNVGVSFFHTSSYAPDSLTQWRAAYDAGFEVALHTESHATNYMTSQSEWS